MQRFRWCQSKFLRVQDLFDGFPKLILSNWSGKHMMYDDILRVEHKDDHSHVCTRGLKTLLYGKVNKINNEYKGLKSLLKQKILA